MAVLPVYSIHEYGSGIFKVVAFKGSRDTDVIPVRDREEQRHNDNKLDSNFSRARSMVLQYGLCNRWAYFFTGTLDKAKMDRYDLDVYASRLMQFIRDMRKKYKSQVQVLLVPERHKDGAWHIHGLVNGFPDDVLTPFAPPAPRRLIQYGYLNWPDYANRFGFCSLAHIRDPVATAFYITKYISKDLSRRSGDLGKHLYFHSRPLHKAEKASDVYLYNPGLDQCCKEDYEFCKTGMVRDMPWYFPYVWDGAEYSAIPFGPKPVEPEPADFRPWEIDPFYEQMKMEL